MRTAVISTLRTCTLQIFFFRFTNHLLPDAWFPYWHVCRSILIVPSALDVDTCPPHVSPPASSGHNLIHPKCESDNLSSDGPVLTHFLCVCNCICTPTHLSPSVRGLPIPNHVNSYAHRPTHPLPRQLVYMQANLSPPMSVHLHVADRSPPMSMHVHMQATHPQLLQCICTQANVSTCKQMCFQSHQCICPQCKHVSGHLKTSAKQANVSLVAPMCLQASRCVPGHISTPTVPTCPPLVLFFSICFVSLTICSQPCQCVCMQAKKSMAMSARVFFFCFFHSTNHLLSSSLTLPPLIQLFNTCRYSCGT